MKAAKVMIKILQIKKKKELKYISESSRILIDK